MAVTKYDNVLTKEFLIKEHVGRKRSPGNIAKQVGCDRHTVASYIDRYNIVREVAEFEYGRMKTHAMWKGYEDIPLTLFNNIRHNAGTRKISFELSIEELWDIFLSQHKKCALTGRDIGFVHSKRGNASLDRKDSSKGYTKDNVWWVHKDVNLAKQSLSTEDFIQLCREVAAN